METRSLHRRDVTGIQKAIQAVRDSSTAINLERPRRVAEKLQRERDAEVAAANLRRAMEVSYDCHGLMEAIDTAKKLSVSVVEASSVLLSWQNHGRSLLASAKVMRSAPKMREILEETRRMGLMVMQEWKVRCSQPNLHLRSQLAGMLQADGDAGV